MIDPVTAIAGATAAFNAIKKGIEVGKDLQDMGGTLAKWSGALADLDFADRQAQQPPWYKALGGGVEAQAMEIFAAKEKAAAMRKELKDFISVYYGPSKWQEILEIEADLRKQKKNTNTEGLRSRGQSRNGLQVSYSFCFVLALSLVLYG